MIKNCIVCNKKFTVFNSRKACSVECSKELKKLTNKKYFDNTKNYKNHLEYMREYMKRFC